jgi:hypothetical protein
VHDIQQLQQNTALASRKSPCEIVKSENFWTGKQFQMINLFSKQFDYVHGWTTTATKDYEKISIIGL